MRNFYVIREVKSSCQVGQEGNKRHHDQVTIIDERKDDAYGQCYVSDDFVALSRWKVKPQVKKQQLCNNSYSKLNEISFKSPSFVLLLSDQSDNTSFLCVSIVKPFPRELVFVYSCTES